MQNPHVPPEKRPSVISAQSAPRPAPFSAPGDRQHLAHPRPALRALVADDDARCRARCGRRGSRPSPRPRRRTPCAGPSNAELVGGQPGDLDDRAARGQRAGEDVDPALGVDRRVERVHDDAVGRRRVEGGEVLGHRAAGDGEHVTVQQAGVEEVLEHDRHAADAVEVAHVELAARLHVGDVRHPRRDAVEVVEVQFDPGLVGDGQQVQHGVRRTADRRRQGDGVLERLLGHDQARRDPELEHPHDGRAGGPGVAVAATVDGRRRRRAGQAHADRLADRAHRVGREHPAARALAGARPALDLEQVGVAEGPGGVGADGLEHAGDVDAPGPGTRRA